MAANSPQPPFFSSSDTMPDRARPPLAHPSSQPSFHASQFSVSAMAGSASGHHPHGASPWSPATPGPSLSNSLSDSFLQSRSSYQPGYLMSMSQNNNSSPQATQRFDDLPIVQTKAKLNSTLSRGPTSEFGKDPMFESSRQRNSTLDEDAPPTASVNDIVNATYPEGASGFSPRKSISFEPSSLFNSSASRAPLSTSQPSTEPIYVVVFGYPPDKYSIAAEYFKQSGDTTEPDPSMEIENCFRIGFKQPGDAMRAVRKNGEVINGSWMVGVKWADPTQAESLLGQSAMRGSISHLQPSDLHPQSGPSDAMAVDEVSRTPGRSASGGARASHSSTPTVGTPIRLAPSASAFRKPGSVQKPAGAQLVATPQAGGGSQAAASPSPSKSIVGQFSDLVFGW